MRCEQLFSHLVGPSEGPLIDGYRNIQPDSADRRARHGYWIMSHDPPNDARRPGARDDLVRLRYYPPGTLWRRSSDRSRRRGEVRSAAEAEPSWTLTRPRVRPIAPGSCPTIRMLGPHHHLPMGTRPSLAFMPIRSPNRPYRKGPLGSSSNVTRRAVECDAAALRANNCTGIITRDVIEFASATESAI